ncbi:MAG TPA: hypothetical protein ENK56_04830 [Chloroflexi bacterium]|nr:hypothetical protein [Chloroflexota bacterium]
MGKKSEEELYIEAIRELKPQLRELLGPEEGTRLNRSLGQYLRWARSPEHRERSLTRALGRIAEHPTLREQLGRIVEDLGGAGAAVRLYQQLPGGPDDVPAGTVMVCPVNPSHCRKRLQYAGQRLRCPQHKVDLVPEWEVKSGG